MNEKGEEKTNNLKTALSLKLQSAYFVRLKSKYWSEETSGPIEVEVGEDDVTGITLTEFGIFIRYSDPKSYRNKLYYSHQISEVAFDLPTDEPRQKQVGEANGIDGE